MLSRQTPRALTLAQVAVPWAGLWRDLLVILGFSALMAALARITVYLPFTPVPVTGQTFGVLLAGAILGSRRGALVMLAYLAEGAAGLPVFSAGGTGITRFFGPTAGYLFSLPFAAFAVGWLAERGWDRRFGATVLAMLVGTAIIYAFGVVWLSLFIGYPQAILQGMLPFLPGDAVKLLLASAILPSAWAVVRRET